MGRSRKIDRDALLDAAQDVLLRDGAAHLTVEAVAANAGISKASVLYDYKTKQALVRAMLERRFETEYDRVRAITDRIEPSANAGIQGWIKSAHRELTDEDRTVAIGLVAALASDPDLNRISNAFFRRVVSDTVETAAEPRGALLAFLAVEGLKLLDYLGLHQWPREEFDAILDDIVWLAGQKPQPDTAPSGQPSPKSK
jgi:AcrR family transcriptional regulator